MKKSNFKKLITLLRKVNQHRNALYKLGVDLNLDEYIDLEEFLLKELFSKDALDVFYWWLYDHDGIEKNPLGLTVDDLDTGDSFKVETIDQLYNYITELENTLKNNENI